ncbi:hypothetical protein LG301_02030 [Vreelandella venusta]|uniref:hypothetical protein n=1 Tax=Vreelandella venusta TaxID=44935 RepID=UPI00384B70DE
MIKKLAICAAAMTLVGCGPSLEMSEDQQRFVDIVEGSKDDYSDAENSIQKSAARERRAERLCAHFADGLEVNGWQGEIDSINRTMTGDAGVELVVAKNLTLKTASSSLTFNNDTQRTLISEESPLFRAVSELKGGDTVQFSGAFLRGSERDCLLELSVTESGSMRMPEFMFNFSKIEKVGG